jgi:ABC-type multidrug transport system ATPase subunit
MDPLLLEAHDVEFAHGRRTVLQDFTLLLPQGRIALLIGLNGAGKTTALNLLAGCLRPRSGSVRLRGENPARPACRRNLFFIEEVSAPASHLRADETVRLHVDLYGRRGSRRGIVEATLDRVGLAPRTKALVRTFSKGMRRRLELACLLAVDPDLWILDEPQAGLDPHGLRLLRELCLEAAARGRGLVMATHALGDVPTLADIVILLRQGRTMFSGDRDQLRESVGAASYVARGGDPAFEADLRALALRHGVSLEGPELPTAAIEDHLFGLEKEAR